MGEPVFVRLVFVRQLGLAFSWTDMMFPIAGSLRSQYNAQRRKWAQCRGGPLRFELSEGAERLSSHVDRRHFHAPETILVNGAAWLVATFGLYLAASALPAHAQSVEEFYRAHPVNLLIGFPVANAV